MVRPILALFFIFSAGVLRAQGADPSAYSSIGIARYMKPIETSYRALFGFGNNEGIGAAAPRSYLGQISYEIAPMVFSAGFMSGNSNSRQPPRTTYTEFDLLYGIALEPTSVHYSGEPEHFHAAVSAGLSINMLQSRWRFFQRGVPQDSLFSLQPPNTLAYSLGLPIQLQAIYEPFRYVGIGALLFYTISTLQPSYGGAVVLELRY